jgi:hypothetical protein
MLATYEQTRKEVAVFFEGMCTEQDCINMYRLATYIFSGAFIIGSDLENHIHFRNKADNMPIIPRFLVHSLRQSMIGNQHNGQTIW